MSPLEMVSPSAPPLDATELNITFNLRFHMYNKKNQFLKTFSPFKAVCHDLAPEAKTVGLMDVANALRPLKAAFP